MQEFDADKKVVASEEEWKERKNLHERVVECTAQSGVRLKIALAECQDAIKLSDKV